MKLAVKPKLMKLMLGAASILGLVLRTMLYTAGRDRKGLLISGYWADTGVWLLTAAVALMLILWCRRLSGSQKYHKAFPPSVPAAIGAALAGISFVLSPVAQVPSPAFGKVELVLRFAAAGSMLWVSFCRFRGKAPHFLLHCVTCVYLALRLVCQYRVWSADPQIQNYAFYLGAHVALMVTAYQFAAFDAGYGSHGKLWAAGLSAIYLSILSLSGSGEHFFLICCILWVWSNLSHPFLKKQVNTDQSTQEEQP